MSSKNGARKLKEVHSIVIGLGIKAEMDWGKVLGLLNLEINKKRLKGKASSEQYPLNL